MKYTIELDDPLDDRVKDCIEEAQDRIKDYFIATPYAVNIPNDILDEIAGTNTPVDYSTMRDIWYFNSDKLVEAYNDAGIGGNPFEGKGDVAIFYYLDQQLHEWLSSVKDSVLAAVFEHEGDVDREFMDSVNELRNED